MVSSGRHVLTLRDLSDDAIRTIVGRGAEFASDLRVAESRLAGRVVGVYFRKTSTRTRTAFSVGAMRLGAQVVSYGPEDLQTNTGETTQDTARVLGGMVDGLVMRTAGPCEEMEDFSRHCGAVVNAMSAEEHPTQALADLTTLAVELGRVEGVRLLYVGEGNNTAAALALALSRFPGSALELRTPHGYGLDPGVLAEARETAVRTGASIAERHDMDDLPEQVDAVYTTRWQTTGTVKPDPDWRTVFAPFRVDRAVMRRCPGAGFMHDLPAHRGEEVAAEVLDGPASIAFAQAQHKLHSAMAVLEWCLGR
ncbi:ornithine carbamoyltransferase [Nocardiopsis kunsanensis]|uniref:Ornithine carbamoyltransferase n=1 Tax=Nocardiopsis kunsanensis TaxID=141693 RepID=A0A918XLD0_9ACTN|nr:ornithine carbamoyltransferase [Nocardiopsis kunsanensis]GHD35853.1 ornithine carbamoyltransferase [Nocardiopsis kunsanensis]